MKLSRITIHNSQLTVQAKLAAIVFLAATLSHAAPPDPFPNMPGLLSAQEIAAATSAMRMTPGSEDLPVVASGRREEGHPMPSYVVFASPLVDFSGQVRMRRQAWCNYFRFRTAWQCTEAHDGFYATSREIEHAYAYRMSQGQGNRQAAAEIADYMYSQCFNTQYAAIGGKPIMPSTLANHVSSVEDDGKGYTAFTGFRGDGDSFRLERTDRKEDGCGFRMVYARIKGVVIPESQARILQEQLKKAAEEYKQQQAKAAAQSIAETAGQEKTSPELPEFYEKWAARYFALNGVSGLLFLVIPWLARLSGRRAAWLTAVVLGAATVAFGVGYAICLKLLNMPEAGHGLLIVAPVTMVTVMLTIIWAVWGATGESTAGRVLDWILRIISIGVAVVILWIAGSLFRVW